MLKKFPIKLKLGETASKNHASFVIPYFFDEQGILKVGFIMRNDGSLAFVGGGVESGESLLDAAVRESKEELNLTLTKDRLVSVCSHQVRSDLTVHAFSYEIKSYTFAASVFGNMVDATHASEIAGFMWVDVINAPNFARNSFPMSVKLELEAFLNSLGD